MNKSTFFSGQPIFTQLLKFIPRDIVSRIVCNNKADRYCKRFNTYEHLVTILYSIFNNCNSLREVATGMLASEQRLAHLGIRYHPRRSTISDANIRRRAEVFENIYFSIFKKYSSFLSDSRTKSRASKLYILDATTISLFHEVLRTGGQIPASGKRKGGIKVHTMIRSDQDVPCMIRYTSAVANDSQFLKDIRLVKGSIIVFDRGYRDFAALNRFTIDNITWVTRRTKLFAFDIKNKIENFRNDQCIISDQHVIMGHKDIKHRVKARLVQYRDATTGEVYEFVTNNIKMSASTIASLYRKRWQIESLFKR